MRAGGPAARRGRPGGAGRRQLVELYLGGEPFEFFQVGRGFERTVITTVPEPGESLVFNLSSYDTPARYVVDRVEPARYPARYPDGPNHPVRVHLRRDDG